MAEHPKGEALRVMATHAAASFSQNQLTQELEDSITAFAVAIQPSQPADALQPPADAIQPPQPANAIQPPNIVARLDTMATQLTTLGTQLTTLGTRVDQILTIVTGHTTMHGGHTTTLDQHTATLAGHTAMLNVLAAEYRHRYKEECIRVNSQCTQPGSFIRWPHLSNGQFPQGIETLAHLDALSLADVNNLITGYAIRHPGPNTQASMLISVKLHVGIPVPPA
jgi:hypothetical protein